MNLTNRKAVITGGAQGLGAALAERLAREGCDLVLFDRKEETLRATADQLTATTGRRVIAHAGDITREADVETLFALARETMGRVDVVIANAAILIAEPICDADASKWKAVLDVNLFGQFLTMKHACRIMKEQQSGSIIQINSKSGKKGSAANSAYAASKFGGIGLVQSVALEMAPHGVRVNAVCPGNLLESPLWTDPENGLFTQYFKAGKVPGATSIDDVRRHYIQQVPLGRGCAYEDVANVVVFLASSASSYMTGQALNVTGGQEMR
ncbi:MAG TPA: SDR family NAD(P)-dependent oxidoreductase [Kiritimatiellia bacterium]|nr:SDR family NAD(P)-dependent oxidoreductase [Kiritimatiellia bacterium]HMO98345.1 SDR family NAD(P)-dependent oxidoreductase [Kiritimatiellia bacterium]HMP95459.1 SDR family NAD(P)-dependent oxidoreductase [Kiritimatiellia bacterium]